MFKNLQKNQRIGLPIKQCPVPPVFQVYRETRDCILQQAMKAVNCRDPWRNVQ